jgi:hypothetical protein
MKQCEKCRLLLSSYFDNKLEIEDEIELRAHLEACPSCSEEYDKIMSFAEALASVSSIKLPDSLTDKLTAKLNAQNITSIKTEVTRGLITHKRQILHALAIIMYTFALLTITAIIIKVSFMQDIKNNENPTVTLRTATSFKQPPVSLKNPPRIKQAEPGVGGQNVNNEAGVLPKPKVVITHTAYSANNLDNARFQPVVLDFSMTYDVKQAPKLLDGYIKKSALLANAAGENGTILAACVREALNNINRPALPAYIEKIKFNKLDAWLVVIVWSPDNAASTLSNSSIFVMDPTHLTIVLKK